MGSPPASVCAGGAHLPQPYRTGACTFGKALAPKSRYITSVGSFASLNSAQPLFSSGGASSPSISRVLQGS